MTLAHGSASPVQSQVRPAGRGRLPSWLLVLFLLVPHLPSLGMGYYADDYVHQVALREPGTFPALPRWNVFDFGTYTDWARLQAEYGGLPWWTGSAWKVRFFRPLASLSLWLDTLLAPGAPIFAHGVSLALYAALLLSLLRLYGALGLDARLARKALLFFGLCDASLLPAGWIANRNSLLCALMLVWALIAVQPRSGILRARGVALALLAGVLAVAAKESGCIVFALVALELLRRRAHSNSRDEAELCLRGACSAALFAILYFAWIVVAGYGTRSSFYITPWLEPARFAQALFSLLSLGGLSLAGPLPLDMLVMAKLNLSLLAWCALPFTLALTRWTWLRARNHRAAGTLASIALLSILPEAGAWISERLLFSAAIGTSGLFALSLEPRVGQRERRGERIWQGALTFSLTIAAGLWLVLQTTQMTALASEIRTIARTAEVGAPTLGKREVLILQAPSALVTFGLPATWLGETGDREVAFWPLQTGRRGLSWTRLDEQSFELTSLDEAFVAGMLECVYLTSDDPIEVGRRWELPLFEVEVLAITAGLPQKLRFRLRTSLDSPHLRYLVAKGGRLVQHTPPAIGETILLESAAPLRPFLP